MTAYVLARLLQPSPVASFTFYPPSMAPNLVVPASISDDLSG